MKKLFLIFTLSINFLFVFTIEGQPIRKFINSDNDSLLNYPQWSLKNEIGLLNKPNQEIIILKDSMVRYNFNSNYDSVSALKQTFIYNNSNDLEYEYWYHRIDNNPDSTWFAQNIFLYDYDENQRLIKKRERDWIEYYQEYNDSFDSYYYYNIEGFINKFERYIIESGKLEDRVLYDYDENGNRNFYEIWDINSQTQNCEPHWQYLYHFNQFGKNDSLIIKQWIKQEQFWRNNSRMIVKFNDLQNEIFKQYEKWSDNNQIWKAFNKSETDYINEFDNIVITYSKEPDSIIWIPQQKNENYFNQLGQNDSIVINLWNQEKNKWSNYYCYSIKYDDNSNYYKYVEYNWRDSSYWEPTVKYMFNYDSFGNQTYYCLYFWDSENQNWNKRENEINFYKILYSNVSEINIESKIIVYPNPFKSNVYFKYNLEFPATVNISFFDNFGKKLDEINEYQYAGNNQVVWNAERFPSGIYFYQAQIDAQTRTGKLVLMK